MRKGRMIVGLVIILMLVLGSTAYAGVIMDAHTQRHAEVLLEGDVLDAVVTAALAEVGEDATVLRAETDADGHATYEVHMLTADGKLVTVYVDDSYAVVSVAENASPGPGWMGVLRGKLKVRDQDGEKIKYQDQVKDRVQKSSEHDQDDDGDLLEASSADRDRDGGKAADKDRGSDKQGGSQDRSKQGGGSRR